MENIQDSLCGRMCQVHSHQTGGADFRAVLSEIADTEIPMPDNDRWADAGMVECDKCQIAWRCLDAQYFGVPQRRKRIFLVADFAESGRSAAKILFECESLCRNPSQSETEEQGASCTIEGISDSTSWERMEKNDSGCIRGADYTTSNSNLDSYCLQGNMIGRKDENGPQGQGHNHEVAFTLNATDIHAVSTNVNVYDISHRSDVIREQPDGKIPCMAARYGTGGGNVPIIHAVHQNQRNEVRLTREISGALTTGGGKPGTGYPCVLIKGDADESHSMAYSFDSLGSNSMKSANPYSGCRKVELSKTLDTSFPDPSKNQGGIAILQKNTSEETETVCLNDQGGNSIGVSTDIVSCLRAQAHGHDPIVCTNIESKALSSVASTLRAGAGAPKHMSDYVERLVIDSRKCYAISGNIIDRADKNGGNHLGIGEDISYTLDTADRHAVCIGNGQMNQSVSEIAGALNTMHSQQAVMYSSLGFAKYKECDTATTLRASGGDLCGGSENLVQSNLPYQKITGALCASDEGGINNHVAEQNKLVVQNNDYFVRSGNGDYTIKNNASCMLSRDYKSPTDLVTIETVRRLTPIECERLQGLPDNYTNVHVKGQKTSDAARYKALGNGMAQPCADFVIRQIVRYSKGVM